MTTEEFVNEFKGLSSIERRFVLIDLMEADLVEFEELATLYIKKLKAGREKASAHRSTLGLFCGVYSMTDKTDHGKHVRKFLYDSRDFTASKFGDALELEFNQTNQNNGQ